MATVEELFADPRYQRPAPAAAAGGPTVEQLFADPRYQRPEAAAPVAAQPPSTDSFWAKPLPADMGWFGRNIGAPLGYMVGKGISGGLQFGQGFVPSQEMEAAGMPFSPTRDLPLTPRATPADANQLVFGTADPQAPGPVSRYAGAATEALTRDPYFAAFGPEAVVGGALAGQGAKDLGAGELGQEIAGAVGGGAAGAVRAGVGALIQRGAVGRIAAALGSSTTKQEAGAVAKAEAESWLTNADNPNSLPALEKVAWEPFDRVLPRTAGAPGGPNVDLTETEKVLKSILKIGADDTRLSDIAAGTGGGSAKKIYGWLLGKEPLADIPTAPGVRAPRSGSNLPPGMEPIAPEFPVPGSVPAAKLKAIEPPVKDTIDPMEWDGVKGLRSWIGQGMKDPIIRDLGEVNRDRLYRALSKDLGTTADSFGLKDEFDAANGVSHALREIAEQHIGKIAQAATPEAAYRIAVQEAKAGGTRLEVLRQHLDNTANEIGAVHLREGLQDPKVWNRLAPEAKTQMVQDPGDLARVERAMALPPVDDGGGAVRSILGGELGAHIGQAALEGLFGEKTGGAIGSVLGALAPATIHGGGLLMRNPASIRYPVIGAMSAPGTPSNSLVLPGR